MRNATEGRSGRLVDRLFIGGCTAACLVLAAAVVAALQLYGGWPS